MGKKVSFATTNWKDKPNKPTSMTQAEWDAMNSSKFNGLPFPTPSEKIFNDIYKRTPGQGGVIVSKAWASAYYWRTKGWKVSDININLSLNGSMQCSINQASYNNGFTWDLDKNGSATINGSWHVGLTQPEAGESSGLVTEVFFDPDGAGETSLATRKVLHPGPFYFNVGKSINGIDPDDSNLSSNNINLNEVSPILSNTSYSSVFTSSYPEAEDETITGFENSNMGANLKFSIGFTYPFSHYGASDIFYTLTEATANPDEDPRYIWNYEKDEALVANLEFFTIDGEGENSENLLFFPKGRVYFGSYFGFDASFDYVLDDAINLTYHTGLYNPTVPEIGQGEGYTENVFATWTTTHTKVGDYIYKIQGFDDVKIPIYAISDGLGHAVDTACPDDINYTNPDTGATFDLTYTCNNNPSIFKVNKSYTVSASESGENYMETYSGSASLDAQLSVQFEITVSPREYFEYDDGNGNPIYDKDTGAILRDPVTGEPV